MNLYSASCNECGFRQSRIELEPGSLAGPCFSCKKIVIASGDEIASHQCPKCGNPVQFYTTTEEGGIDLSLRTCPRCGKRYLILREVQISEDRNHLT